MPDTNRPAPDHASMSVLAALALLSATAAAAQEPASVARASSDQSLPPSPAAIPAAKPGASGLSEYQRLYTEALANGLYGEAEAAAKRMIDLIIADDHGEKPMAEALSSLALAQKQGRLYGAALQNYQAAIELLESSENRLSESVIGPLRGLGDTYAASGHADLALAAYEHALHIRHVNDGPYTLGQIDILDAMATALAEGGQVDAALGIVDRIYRLYARAYAPDDEEVLPALERKALLLNEAGRHQQERAVYREIMRIIQNRRGESDLSLLKTYMALGHTYFYDLDEAYFRSEPTTETGETFLKKALELAESHPDATWLMRERILIELGDYYTVRDVQDRARIHYRRAWNLLSEAEDRSARRQRDLESVVLLVQPKLDPYANFGYRSSDADADISDYRKGHVVARFTVNGRGRVMDVRIVDADPAGFYSMEARVVQAVQDFIYRPRYRGGSPAPARGQTFRHDYLYRDSDLAADRE
jgi:tetratricopeptide (TPR) repeat protein